MQFLSFISCNYCRFSSVNICSSVGSFRFRGGASVGEVWCFAFPRRSFDHSRGKVRRSRPSARPRRVRWVTGVQPIWREYPPTPQWFDQSGLFKAVTWPDFSPATPSGYKTPDNKVSISVEAVNNRLPRKWQGDVFIFYSGCKKGLNVNNLHTMSAKNDCVHQFICEICTSDKIRLKIAFSRVIAWKIIYIYIFIKVVSWLNPCFIKPVCNLPGWLSRLLTPSRPQNSPV